MEVDESLLDDDVEGGGGDDDDDDEEWSDMSSEEEEEDDEDKLTIDCGGAEEQATAQAKQSPSLKRSARINARKRINDIDVPKDIAELGCTKEFSQLHEKAKKLHMNRTQVKSVIRRLIETPELMQHILESAGDIPPSDSPVKIEPKMTRTKAKSLAQDGAKLDWVLENYSPNKNKPKNSDLEQLLATAELPEEDESDHEYDPSADAEAAAFSDVDDDSVLADTPASAATFAASPTGSVRSSGGISTPNAAASADDGFARPSAAAAGSSCSKHERELAATDNVPSRSTAARLLDFDAAAAAAAANDKSNVRQTRSVKSLKEVPIEQLEALSTFPDATPDLYDWDPRDDYTDFLQQFFYPDSTKNKSTYGETADDDDPDFEYQENTKELDELQYEYKFDRSTKIPKAEQYELYQDLLDLNTAAGDLDSDDEENKRNYHKKNIEDRCTRLEVVPEAGAASADGPMEAEDTADGGGGGGADMTQHQRDLIGHQMRQHIQLLTQTALLSSNNPHWSEINACSKKMMADLIHQSLWNPLVAQDNLYPSNMARIVWEATGTDPTVIAGSSAASGKSTKKAVVKNPVCEKKSYGRDDLNPKLLDFMAPRTAFLYPHLLPVKPFDAENDKLMFAKAENYLVIMGLDRFKNMKTSRKNSLLSDASDKCAKLVVTAKTGLQVKRRVKNRSNRTGDDVINVFMTRKNVKAPITLPWNDFTKPYASVDVKAPSDCALADLPQLWRQHLFSGVEAPEFKGDKRTASFQTAVVDDVWERFMTTSIGDDESASELNLPSSALKAEKQRGASGNLGASPPVPPSDEASRRNTADQREILRAKRKLSAPLPPSSLEASALSPPTAGEPLEGTVTVVSQFSIPDLPTSPPGGGSSCGSGAGEATGRARRDVVVTAAAPSQQHTRFRPILCKGSVPGGSGAGAVAATAKQVSPLKQHRRRILKKYSPMKVKRPILPKESFYLLTSPKLRLLKPKPILPGDSAVQTATATTAPIAADQGGGGAAAMDGGAVHATAGAPAELTMDVSRWTHDDGATDDVHAVHMGGKAQEQGDLGRAAAFAAASSTACPESCTAAGAGTSAMVADEPEQRASASAGSAVAVAPTVALTLPMSKTRKTKHQKEISTTIALLDTESEDGEVRADREATELLNAVQEALEETQIDKFHEIMTAPNLSPPLMFTDLHRLFHGNIAIQELLLDLLSPADAVHLGRDVYLQYQQRTAVKSFFTKLSAYFRGQPTAYNRVVKELAVALNKPDFITEDLKAVATKNLRFNKHLLDVFMSLIPQMSVPDSLLPSEAERLELGEDSAEDDDEEYGLLAYERMQLTGLPESDDWGSDGCCPCDCHPSDPPSSSSGGGGAADTVHCMHCGLRFANGRVWTRDGKMLKPVKVEYGSGVSAAAAAAAAPAIAAKQKARKK